MAEETNERNTSIPRGFKSEDSAARVEWVKEFTGIEIRMLTKVVYGALDDLGKAWKSLTPLEPFFERIEINPKFTVIVPPEEVVASTTFDVEINRVPYTMSFCLPYAMLDPVRARIEAGKASYDEEVNAINVSRLEENLRNSKVGVKVALGEAHMTLRHFLSLQSGDRIMLDQHQDKPLTTLLQLVANSSNQTDLFAFYVCSRLLYLVFQIVENHSFSISFFCLVDCNGQGMDSSYNSNLVQVTHLV